MQCKEGHEEGRAVECKVGATAKGVPGGEGVQCKVGCSAKGGAENWECAKARWDPTEKGVHRGEAMDKCASIRGWRNARQGARRQGGAVQRGRTERQGVLMQGWTQGSEGVKMQGGVHRGKGGARSQRGPNAMAGRCRRKGGKWNLWTVLAAGGVQWGDEALHRAQQRGGGRETVGARPMHPKGRQPKFMGPAEHPGHSGESGAVSCPLHVCCLEMDSHGLLSLSMQAPLWGDLWGGGICRAMTSRGMGLVSIGCYSGPTWCCNFICARWYRLALCPGH